MTIGEEIDKIIEEVMNDPELPKKVEEYQKKIRYSFRRRHVKTI